MSLFDEVTSDEGTQDVALGQDAVDSLFDEPSRFSDEECEAVVASVLNKSSTESKGKWGVVFAGSNELVLDRSEDSRALYWSEKDEEVYLARVKEKAVAQAKEIIAQAQEEVARIHEEAREAGYNTGMSEAEKELQTFRDTMADSVSSVLTSIEDECHRIYTQWREEIVEVACLAAEKVVVQVLSEDRTQLLTHLFADSIVMMEHRRVLNIKVHPEDAPVIQDIIEQTKIKYPDITAWQVVADNGLSPGSLVLENESSLAKSTVESRKAAVDEVLRHLTLPDVS